MPFCQDNKVTVIAYTPLTGGVGNLRKSLGSGVLEKVAKESGKTEAQARALFDNFHEMCAGDDDGGGTVSDPEMEDDVDRLQVLAGVRQFPMRVKCATLAWHTMKAAMEGRRAVSTEDED